MSPIKFTLPIVPISVQHSARARVIRGKFCGMYSDSTKVLFVDTIINESKHMAPKEPLKGPLYLRMDFHMENPKGLSGYADKCTSDVDNIAKGVQDGLSKAKFWQNDKQIVHLECTKQWCSEDLFPCIEVTIKQL